MVVRPYLAVLADGGLEVVGFDGRVEDIADLIRFVQRGEAALGIPAAVIHVVADARAAASNLAESEGCDIAWLDLVSPVVGDEHAAAGFGCQKGILRAARLVLPAAHGVDITRDRFVDALFSEDVVVKEALRFLDRALPSRVGIGAVEGNHLAVWHRVLHAGPAGFCVERHIDACLECEIFQAKKIARGT